MNMADEYNGIFCATCGHMAEFDCNGLVPCPMCKCTEYVKASVPYISQVISHMLTCCGVKLERILNTDTENSRKYKQYLKGSRNPRDSNYVQNMLASGSGLGLDKQIQGHYLVRHKRVQYPARTPVASPIYTGMNINASTQMQNVSNPCIVELPDRDGHNLHLLATTANRAEYKQRVPDKDQHVNQT